MIFSMMAGTMFAIWLGQLISEYGIRNQGLSLIIFAGIISQVPTNFARIMSDEASRWFILVFIVVLMVLIIFAIVFVQQGRRNVPVMYPGRRVGNRMSMPVKGTLPLMVNMAGMIPLIFAQSLLTFPAIIASFFGKSSTEWLANLSRPSKPRLTGQAQPIGSSTSSASCCSPFSIRMYSLPNRTTVKTSNGPVPRYLESAVERPPSDISPGFFDGSHFLARCFLALWQSSLFWLACYCRPWASCLINQDCYWSPLQVC